jgi:hypothetical protein
MTPISHVNLQSVVESIARCVNLKWLCREACSVSHPKITFFCSLNCITSHGTYQYVLRQHLKIENERQHMLLREVINNTRGFFFLHAHTEWIQNAAGGKSVREICSIQDKFHFAACSTFLMKYLKCFLTNSALNIKSSIVNLKSN